MAETDPTLHEAELGAYLVGKLDPAQRRAFEDHLGDCAACAHELEELGGVSRLLAAAAPPAEPPPPDLEARTFAAIAAEPQPARPAVTATRGAGGNAPFWRRWQRRWLPGVAVVTAAAMVVVVLVAGHFAGSGQPPAQTIQLVSASGGVATGSASLRTTTTGTAIDLTVHGLPASPPGHYYECWLVGAGDSPQHQNRESVGSFVVTGPGDVTVHWDTAADLSRFPRLGVTLEPDNGDPRLQGPKVLVMA